MLKKQKGLFKWKLCSGHSLRSWRDKRGSVAFFWRRIREKGEYTSQLQVRGKIPPEGFSLTVWLNGRHNSGLVNFFRELRLSCLKISSMHRKTAANTANQSLKLNGSWKRVSKMALKKESQISIWNILPAKYNVGLILTLNFTLRCLLGIFPWAENAL